jgi:prephenate dehydrogenase
MAPHLGPDTIVTDAGSTKRDVIEAVYRHSRAQLAQVVPAHPIAGAEKSGPTAARADLYRGRKVVITPLPENDPAGRQGARAVGGLWRRASRDEPAGA